MMERRSIFVFLTILFLEVPVCLSQGRMQMPLGRSSIWRAGVDAPENYDDHMLECGGFDYKKKRGNECGMCGDPVDKSRDNEAGGKYDSGIMAAAFSPGERTQFKVLMMSNRGGYMEFKMCPSKPASQQCFDSHPVKMADGSGSRYYLPDENVQGVISIDVIIPPMTCQNCVMQWTYTGSADWGFDDSGFECRGCGPQYELRNCADVAITTGGAPLDPAIQKYNDAENGGRNPLGTYHFDPWANAPESDSPSMNGPQSGSPFVQDPWVNPALMQRPMGTNQVDPWTGPTGVNSQFGRDPWTNPSMPTPAPRTQMRNNQPDPWTPTGQNQRDPWTPMTNSQPDPWGNPPRSGSPFVRDPWTNPAMPAPAQRTPMGSNQRDPWVNPSSSMNHQPTRMGGNNQMQNNQRDPWQGTPRATPAPRTMGNNQRDPWPNAMQNNQRDPWPSTPRANPAPGNMGNNQRDPWPSTPRATPAPRMQNNQRDPWPNTMQNNQRDPWPSTPRANPAPRNTGNTGTNQRDPWPNTMQNNQRDPWPSAPRATPAPRMSQNNQRDPWPNTMQNNQRDQWPGTPRATPAPRMPQNNQRDPWPNAMQNNQRDPWPSTPRANPAPRMPQNIQRDPWPNTMQNNQNDPWPSTPTDNPAPRMTQNNQRDPWPSTPVRGNNQMNPSPTNNDPWVGPQAQNPPRTGLNPADLWPNAAQRTPAAVQMRDPWRNSPQGNTNQMSDPWVGSPQGNGGSPVRSTQNRINDPWVGPQQGNPEAPAFIAPWVNQPQNNVQSSYPQQQQQQQSPSPDSPHDPSLIYSVEVRRQQVVHVPSMTCVAVGEKAGEEGMDRWCTDNCNLNYCPPLMCTC